MQALKNCLAVSPFDRERIEREDRAHFRNLERISAKSEDAEARLASANSKRERRQARNHRLVAAG